MIQSRSNLLSPDRLLVIAPDARLADLVRERYPDCEVTLADSVLEGITRLCDTPVRAVVAYVNPQQLRLGEAVAGLREAVGTHARVLLCCEAGDEPMVRQALPHGADDYLVYPPGLGELDAALGFVRDDEDHPTPCAGFSADELRRISEAVAAIAGEPYALLSKLCDMVRAAMGSTACRLVADGSAATSGSASFEPVINEAVRAEGRDIGRISLGPRHQGPGYGPADHEKLAMYARLTGQLLHAATQQRDWRQRALVDEMSGLYNRRYAVQFLDDVLERARSERFRVTVLMFDVDDFKTYNDTYGHDAGDGIIRHIGCLFKSHCREHDVVTRYGGDEFLVIFWDADEPRVAGSSHPTDAITVLERFKQALRERPCEGLGDAVPGSITISGGLASFPWDASTARELIGRADQALLLAKKSGKNQVLVFGQDADSPRGSGTGD